MAISGKIKIWTGDQCDYCGRAAHNCQSWAINWLAHWSLQEGIENRCPKTEDRTRTRRSWHNILEACSGCQHFMLVVSESQLAVAATASAAEISLRTVRVFPLQKKQVLERRSQNNRVHPNPVVRSFVRAQKTKATTYNTLWHKIGNKIEQSMWKSPSRSWGQAFYCPPHRSCLNHCSILSFSYLALFLSFSRSAPFDALNLREPNPILLLNFFVLRGNS